MIQFANPSWLWALTGLLIPMAIHMLSRKEGKIIAIGSLRHLTETDTARFSSIRLNEVLLLVARCLLIILLVLLLAGTSVSLFEDSSEKWLLIDRGIEKEESLKSLIDSLSEEGYELHWLANGFPPAADSTSSFNMAGNYWAMADDLRKKENVDAVVISYNYLHKFKGNRVTMPENVRWITYDPAAQGDLLAKAISLSGDSLWVRTIESSSLLTRLQSEKNRSEKFGLADTEVDNNDTIRIAVYAEEKFDYDAKIIQACLSAVQASIPYHLEIVRKNVTDQDEQPWDWIVWLSEKKAPDSYDHSIIYRGCPGNALPMLISGWQANVVCSETRKTHGWVLTKRLTEDAAMDENLPVRLASIILSDKKTEFHQKEKRVLASAMMWSEKNSPADEANESTGRSIQSILAITLMLALIAERWLSFKRNQ
jgi:hypothetical protein